MFLGWGTLSVFYVIISKKGGDDSERQAYSLYKYLCLWTLCLVIWTYARICMRPRGAVLGRCKWGDCMTYYNNEGQRILPL